LLFRALAQLFDELRMQQDAEFSVRVSYLELYNEEIFDLLSATEDTTRLQLYEDSTKKGSVIIKVKYFFLITYPQEHYPHS
jgi:kinesin family protein 11